MLVLSRRIGESIVINDQICVSIAAVHGKRVRLAIAAPSSIPIHRQEIYRQRLEFELHDDLQVDQRNELLVPALLEPD